MGLECFSYYGRLDPTLPLRTLAEDFIDERNRNMFQELKEMEERIKRHITECKREVIKEMLGLKSKKPETKKEKHNGSECTERTEECISEINGSNC